MSGWQTLTRRRLLGATGAGTVAALAGCTGGNGNGDGRSDAAVHVFTDYNNEPWQDRWEEVIQPEYEETTGLELDIEYAGFQGDSEQRLSTLIQSGDPPDLHVETFYATAEIWANGMLEPVTGIVDQIESVAGPLQSNNFVDEQGLHSQGDQFLVPHGMYTNLLIYREDIYDALGLEVPETWDELVANAQAIDEADIGDGDSPDVRGFATPGAQVGQSRELFWVFLYTNGVYPFEEVDGEIEVRLPEAETVEAMETIKELSQYSPDPSSLNWGESLTQWTQGRIGQMYHVNPWAAGVAADAGVDVIAENTGIAPMPRNGIPPEESYQPGPTLNGWMVFSDGDNSEGGRELIEWMYGEETERTVRNYTAEPMRMLPAYGDVVNHEAYESMDIFQEYPGLLDLNQQVLDDIVPEHFGRNDDDIPDDGVTNYAISGYYFSDMMNEILVADRDIQAAYEDIVEAAEERLEEGKDIVHG